MGSNRANLPNGVSLCPAVTEQVMLTYSTLGRRCRGVMIANAASEDKELAAYQDHVVRYEQYAFTPTVPAQRRPSPFHTRKRCLFFMLQGSGSP